jgi:hypothetical protein
VDLHAVSFTLGENLLPDTIPSDLAPAYPPLFVFVEMVASDEPIAAERRERFPE